MRYVEAAGARLSAVGLGTWQFGSGEWGYGSEYASVTAPLIVNRSLDLGINVVDTAEAYAFGRSETIVGQAIDGRRDEMFLATKLFPILPFDPIVARRAGGSLRRLRTDVLDLYQLHWPNPVVPLHYTMSAMGRLQRQGAVRHVGVSNFSLARWQQAEAALGGPVLSNQVRYSLIDRAPERELVPWAQANDRVVIAYSPLSQGLLSGRYDAEHLPTGLRATTPAFLPENVRRAGPLVEALRQVADAHGCTCSQVALAWLLHRPQVVVIPGASSLEQAEANAAAADIELAPDEESALTAASDAYRPLQGTAAATALVKVRAERVAGRVRRTAEGLRS